MPSQVRYAKCSLLPQAPPPSTLGAVLVPFCRPGELQSSDQIHNNLSKLWTSSSGLDGENMYIEFQATSCLYFLISDSKGAMMASNGTDSSSF